MADRRLAIEITVEGDAARAFKEIGDAARSSAETIESSSKRTEAGIERIEKAADDAETQVKELEAAQKKAAKAADEMAAHSEKAGRSLDRYKDSITKTQQGLALLGTAFTMYAGQAVEHERSVMALQRVYGDAADSYIQFANQIQNTSIFSNDEALAAARIMGTLRENYDLTDQQIQQLIQTSADLATMHGLTLTDAAMRVQSAIRGEAESAEMLGLTMNQAAIDSQGLTLTMTNAEAAAFRFDVMMQQAASSTGAAAEAAETDAGKVQQLANEFQDAMVAVVRFTGPIGEAAGVLGTFGIEAGIAAGGLARLGQGMAALRGTAAITSLVAAGPALLAGGGIVAALGLTALAAYDVYKALTDSDEAVSSHQLSVDALAGSYDELGESIGNAATLAGAEELHTQITSGLEQMQSDLEYFQTLWEEINNPSMPASMMQTQIVQYEEFVNRFGESAEEAGYKLTNMRYDLAAIISSGNVQAIREASAAWDEFLAGDQSYEDLLVLHDTINDINHNLADYEYQANLAADANTAMAGSASDATTAITAQSAAVSEQTQAQIDANAAYRQWLELHGLAAQFDQEQSNRTNIGNENQTRWLANYAEGIDDVALAFYGIDASAQLVEKSYADLDLTISESERSWRTYTEALADNADQAYAAREALAVVGAAALGVESAKQAAIDEARALTEAFEAEMRAAFGLSDALYDLQARGGSTSIDLAVNTGGAQNALQSGFNAIVGGSNAMGQISQQTADWASSLTDANTGMSQLDNLMLDGAISAKTYRDALEANHKIQVANESVQEDMLRIQAKQLPVMAALAEEHARYVDQLADEDVMTQTVALGYMDQTKASQAMQLANLAATASLAGTEEAASKTITAMAEADPVMKAMLLDMGLIEEGANGTISVKFPDSGSLTTSVDNLTLAIDALTIALGGVPSTVTTNVNLIDNASTPLSILQNHLDQIDGKTATVYINTLQSTVGFTPEGYATGGVVRPPELEPIGPPAQHVSLQRLATGGQVQLVGEVGPELVTLPAGSMVTNAAGTRGRLNPRGRGRRRGNGGDVIIVKGTNHMTVVQDDSALRDFSRKVAGKRR